MNIQTRLYTCHLPLVSPFRLLPALHQKLNFCPAPENRNKKTGLPPDILIPSAARLSFDLAQDPLLSARPSRGVWRYRENMSIDDCRRIFPPK